jgi:DNA mismatch repair protein MutL
MGRIERLPEHLANQIAAGEVVERPASVVKELVENALDAGATRIKVELENGGMTLVRVVDDGEGMSPNDALLSLERHATSKIRAKEDLFTLRTFGFRGEALPSIASVARLRLLTRGAGLAEATEVTLEGNGSPVVRPCGAPEGTTLEVRELFFNVPARRKFLKSAPTEAAHVTEALLLAALARHDVSFFLVRDGRPAREWLRVATRRDRVAQIFENERLEPCLGERGPMRIEAHLAAPERARAGAVALHLLVNGRAVRDRSLARAVAQAYGSVLPVGRYPVGVVYVEAPPDQVDVNVHPQKAEVRFADGRALFDAVTKELHESLARAFSVPSAGIWRSGYARSSLFSSPAMSLADSRAAVLASPEAIVSELGSSLLASSEKAAAESAANEADPWDLTPPPAAAVTGGVAGSGAATDRGPAPPQSLFDGAGFYGSLDFLAQVRSTFLVCAGADGLYVLDQHAAAERVTFHRLRRAFAQRAMPRQRLLIPEVIDLLPAEVIALEERIDDVVALGVELRPVGQKAVAIDAVPMLLARSRPERIVRDLVAELGRTAKRPFGDASDLVLATMACHGSIRAGDVVSREEATSLLTALDEIDFAGHCPHGRPVVTRIGYDDLERRVGR